jgi:hypothetical protein
MVRPGRWPDVTIRKLLFSRWASRFWQEVLNVSDWDHEGACSSLCDCYICHTKFETPTKYCFVSVTLHKNRRFILSRDRVSVGGVWIGSLINCTLKELVTALYRSLSHTDTSVLSHGLHCAAWYRLPTVDVPLLPGSRPRRLTAISHHPHTLLIAV